MSKWKEFISTVLKEKLTEEEFGFVLQAEEDGDDYVAHLEGEIRRAHEYLDSFNVGKDWWDLDGRIALVIAEPKGNIFESRVVCLLAVLADLVRASEVVMTEDSQALVRAKAMLESADSWWPGFGDLTVSYFATGDELAKQFLKSIGMDKTDD